ncbi:Clp protease ClpP [Epilithonimonas mollis]|uniref:ATP-dependent Clp endopeptidase, proteolytic subunit ClpP n=1 Tax=Epilithonimonas mollis TaxID=216903 RepID=A0A1M6UQM1_9FLAO|nr:ATP-dependent Clp protease proteolytic subunit [Epilithonimonas mollis]SHK71463.1 ATP-dependent Clp endopeptidase, proteolytic subunit ClpP [Epilithonimonas mollis]
MNFEIKENVLEAFGDIYDGDGSLFVSALSQLEQKEKHINIKLHTYGGSVFEGNIMCNAISNCKSEITIDIIGIAASMGAVICASVEDVYMVENGYLMIHAPSGGGFGTAQHLESNAKLLRSIEANFIKKLTLKTGKSAEYVQKWLVGDNWFSAEQALDEGLISGVINSENNINANFNPQELPTKEAFARFDALYNKNYFNSKNMDLKKELIKKFNFSANTSDTKIIQEIEDANNLKTSIIELLGLAEDVSNDDILEAIKNQLNEQQTSTDSEAKDLTTQAIRNGQITAKQEKHILGMFKKDFAGTKSFLESSPRKNPMVIAERIVQGTVNNSNTVAKPKSEWDLNDYRKNAPKELEQNPELYQKLVKAKYK